jgi:NAD(P)-dependent dehydrogenase (short-subunit alcohol dehydrogenase family)
VQKAALRVLTRGFAAELAPSGVHCATVTVTGTLGTPGFAVGDIAGVYADLVAETSGPPETWRTVVEFTGVPS